MKSDKPFYLPCGSCGIDLENYEGFTIYCPKCHDVYCELCFGFDYCLVCENNPEENVIEI